MSSSVPFTVGNNNDGITEALQPCQMTSERTLILSSQGVTDSIGKVRPLSVIINVVYLDSNRFAVFNSTLLMKTVCI